MTDSPARPQFARSFRSSRTILALILRDIASSNGRTALGYLWVLAEPVAGILLLTLIFSLFFVAPPLGTNFPLFYASGLLPFMMYMQISQRIAGSVRASKPLLAYPGVTFLDAIMAKFLLESATEALVFALVIVGIVIWFGLNPYFDIPALLAGLGLAALLALGVGTLNCLLLSLYPLWERFWAILNRPLMIVSGAFFLFDTVPQPYRDWLWWNPIIHVVGMVRAGLYPTYDTSYVSVLYVLAFCAVTFTAGLFFLRRYWREIVFDV